MDGTIFSTDLPVRSTQTGAECTQGIDYCAYKKMWGYGPLMLSLAHTCLPVRHRTQTGEPLYVVNRPASAPSHQGVAIWLDRALKLVGPYFEDIWFRGDADFSLTVHFDRPACADLPAAQGTAQAGGRQVNDKENRIEGRDRLIFYSSDHLLRWYS